MKTKMKSFVKEVLAQLKEITEWQILVLKVN